MRNVTTDVSSPIISHTGTTGLSDMFSSGMGFQFFMMREPLIERREFCILRILLP